MAKPAEVKLSKKDQKAVLSMWKGTKSEPGIKNARKISEYACLPSRQVMLFLETQNLCSFSEGSYC